LGDRILLCIPTLEGGGSERQVTYLARELAERGWNVTIALIRLGSNAELLFGTDVRIAKLNHGGHYDPRLALELARLYRTVRPQVIHTYLEMMDILGGALAVVSGTPWVATERASAQGHRGFVKKQARTKLLRVGARAIVANSEAGRAYIRSKVSARIPTVVIPNGIPVAEVEAADPLPRSEMRVPADADLVLFAGRFSPEKNLTTLLRAVPEVALSRPGIVVVCCGEGPLQSEALALTRQLGIGDRVRFPGYVSDLPRWMRSSDVFVSASLHEGHPNVVLEAMAAGIPIVVSDISSHREFLTGDSAVLFDPDSPTRLARALISSLEDRTEAKRRAREGLRRVRRLDIASMTSQHEEVYKAAMRARS
jgi:glycosyltransferase involved in cell wall biosynthesis